MQLDSWIVNLGVAFALGCDAFAVGMAVGTRLPDRRAQFRLWFHFGLFQFLMTLGGWAVGASILQYIAAYDHWVAGGLMTIIATNMLRESFSDDDENKEKKDPTRGWPLIALSIATSFDAFGVGFSLGLAAGNLLGSAVVIGLVAGIMTWLGLRLGKCASEKFGKRVETVGASILYVIAYNLFSI